MLQSVSGNSFGSFGNFRIFFVALLIYLDISGLIFAQENISLKKKKSNPILFGRARGLDPACSDPHPLAQPAKAHLGLATRGHGGHVAAAAFPRRARHARHSLPRL
jgi:hypothetical protein